MARVISDKPVGAWEETCPGCRYRVEFHPGDIIEFRDHDEGENVRYVTCPKCNRIINKPKNRLDSGDYDV